MVQSVHAFGRRGGVHVGQVFTQEQLDVVTRGVVAVNGNHRSKFTRCGPCGRCAKIPMIVTRTEEVGPMKAVSVMGAPSQPTIRG